MIVLIDGQKKILKISANGEHLNEQVATPPLRYRWLNTIDRTWIEWPDVGTAKWRFALSWGIEGTIDSIERT